MSLRPPRATPAPAATASSPRALAKKRASTLIVEKNEQTVRREENPAPCDLRARRAKQRVSWESPEDRALCRQRKSGILDGRQKTIKTPSKVQKPKAGNAQRANE